MCFYNDVRYLRCPFTVTNSGKTLLIIGCCHRITGLEISKPVPKRWVKIQFKTVIAYPLGTFRLMWHGVKPFPAVAYRCTDSIALTDNLIMTSTEQTHFNWNPHFTQSQLELIAHFTGGTFVDFKQDQTFLLPAPTEYSTHKFDKEVEHLQKKKKKANAQQH